MLPISSLMLALGVIIARVSADHSITTINRCGYGTPMMYGPTWEGEFANGPINIAGGFYTTSDLYGGIIYLQNNGRCGWNGENCMIIEATLVSESTGQTSSVDISRIPPHEYDQPISFALWPDNQGATCNNPNCQCDFDAYCSSGDNGAIRGDWDNNVGLTVYFC